MPVHSGNTYLLKAMEAFAKKLIVISTDFTILAANATAQEEIGAHFAGRKCYALLYGRSEVCGNCPAREVIQTLTHTLRDSQRKVPDLDRISCLYAYPVVENGTLTAVTVMDFEFPLIEGLEDKLQRTNAFLRNLLHSAVDGVIAADMTGKIIIFNHAAVQVSGYSIEEALNQLNIRQIYPGDGAREVMRRLRSEAYGGKGKLTEYHVDFLGKSGEKIPISLYASIVYENGKEVASIGFFHDLRKRIQIQKELEKTQLQLMQSEKMASLGKLAAGVAHQLNNPLGSITLYAKLVMEEYDLVEAAREDMLRILKDAQRCRDTVRELLEFARQTRQFMKPSDINRAISRTIFLLENQSLFQNIKIKKQIDTPLPLVEADIQQLNHMFMNVILNAAQAMDGKGELTIHTALAPNGKHVIIEIGDTGPGIPETVINHIFEPFFTTKEEGQGTGLGLSMVYGIVENHSGSITAGNRQPGGAVFTIKLPISRSDTKGDNHGK